MAGPLAGIRVVDLTTVGPGARAAALLADLGADVVKVGPPAAAGRIVAGAWAYSAGRGCRRIGLDLKADAGREVLLRLAERADVVLEGFRPGVADRLGIGAATLRERNPRLVYAALTGYGQDGPYADWAGHDINYQAVAGALAAAGREADGTPAIPGATFADSAGGGMHAVLSICAALVERATTGTGTTLDVAAVDGMLSLMSLTLDEHLATGRAATPRGTLLQGRYAFYDTYSCDDGRFVAVGAIEPKFFANLCRGLGCEQWLDHQHDDEVQDKVRADFAAAFLTRTRDEWVAELGPADACVSAVLAVDEVPDDPHLSSRFADAEVDGEPLRQTGRVLAGSRAQPTEVGVAPTQTDPHQILTEIGIAATDVDRLIEDGVVQ